MTQIEKLKKQVNKTLAEAKKAKKKEVELITLKRDAFKKNLSAAKGFGSQDFKPAYLELYTYLLKKFGAKLITIPKAQSTANDFGIVILAKL